MCVLTTAESRCTDLADGINVSFAPVALAVVRSKVVTLFLVHCLFLAPIMVEVCFMIQFFVSDRLSEEEIIH